MRHARENPTASDRAYQRQSPLQVFETRATTRTGSDGCYTQRSQLPGRFSRDIEATYYPKLKFHQADKNQQRVEVILDAECDSVSGYVHFE